MNEFQLIDLITKGAPRCVGDLIQGVGDDCAIIGVGKKHRLITADTLVEGVHFKLSFTKPRTLGRKALNINVSDVAAMGGNPRFYTSCIAIPTGFTIERIKDLYEGMFEAAAPYDIILIGGDTVTAPADLSITITLIGDVDAGKPILRSGARPGDALYVTGMLGNAALGLQCLRRGYVDGTAEPFIMSYRDPIPRLEAGRWLARTGMVTSMIDISDGLMADAGHLAEESKTGYEIVMSNVPKHDALEELSRRMDILPHDLIMGGGDDYELAFTVAGSRVEEFEHLLKAKRLPFDHAITRIGTMVEDVDRRNVIDREGSAIAISRSGYDHFEGTL